MELTVPDTDEAYMAQALTLAKTAFEHNEVPVGAVVVDLNGAVIGRGWNQPIFGRDPTAHAEIQAIRQAGIALDNYRLTGCSLFVTLEPCTMCLGAMIHARIGRLVFGALEPKAGAVVSANNLLEEPYFNHRLQWQGEVMSQSCGELVSAFFEKRRREKKNRD